MALELPSREVCRAEPKMFNSSCLCGCVPVGQVQLRLRTRLYSGKKTVSCAAFALHVETEMWELDNTICIGMRQTRMMVEGKRFN